MELFCWLSAVSATPHGLLLEQGPGFVTMKPSEGAYACVAQLRRREMAGKLMSATALLRVVAGDQTRYVLLQRDATASLEALRWQFPAGRCSPNENPVETALREMVEEVQLQAPSGITLEDAVALPLENAPRHQLRGPDLSVKFQAPYIDEANTLEFFVPVVLALPTLDGLQLSDNEPYGRRVQAFTRPELLLLAEAGQMTGAASAILRAALALDLL